MPKFKSQTHTYTYFLSDLLRF